MLTNFFIHEPNCKKFDILAIWKDTATPCDSLMVTIFLRVHVLFISDECPCTFFIFKHTCKQTEIIIYDNFCRNIFNAEVCQTNKYRRLIIPKLT